MILKSGGRFPEKIMLDQEKSRAQAIPLKTIAL